jgi:hypothetical protein
MLAPVPATFQLQVGAPVEKETTSAVCQQISDLIDGLDAFAKSAWGVMRETDLKVGLRMTLLDGDQIVITRSTNGKLDVKVGRNQKGGDFLVLAQKGNVPDKKLVLVVDELLDATDLNDNHITAVLDPVEFLGMEGQVHTGALSLPRVIKEVSRQEVIEAENAANSKGKHENNPYRTFYTVDSFSYGRDSATFYLIEVPIKLLNHQYDPEDPDSQPLSDATNARIDDYASRETKAPPVLITYASRKWPTKYGKGLAFVANGNHRVEAARRAGKTTVEAYMPSNDYDFWVGTVLAAEDGPLGRAKTGALEDAKSLDFKAQLNALKPKLAQAAQQVYDKWDASDEVDGDFNVGFGGICHLIADAMAEVIEESIPGAATTTLSHDSMVHVSVVAWDEATEETQEDDDPDEPRWIDLYHVDINPYLYETGGGYNWQKIPDVQFDASFISISRDRVSPEDLEALREG